MPAPAYKWTVTLGAGSPCPASLDAEAAYSAIEDTGHMVLKNADGNPVFTAEPGLGCTFERRGKVAADSPGLAPVAFAEFEEAWGKACADAWDDGQRRPAVLLPDFMWPGVASMTSPVSGEPVTVIRVRTFPVQNGPGGADSCCGEGVACSGCA